MSVDEFKSLVVGDKIKYTIVDPNENITDKGFVFTLKQMSSIHNIAIGLFEYVDHNGVEQNTLIPDITSWKFGVFKDTPSDNFIRDLYS